MLNPLRLPLSGAGEAKGEREAWSEGWRRRAGSGTAACDGPGMMGALGSVLALLLPPLLQVLAAAPRGLPLSSAGAAAEARIGEWGAGRAGSGAAPSLGSPRRCPAASSRPGGSPAGPRRPRPHGAPLLAEVPRPAAPPARLRPSRRSLPGRPGAGAGAGPEPHCWDAVGAAPRLCEEPG